MTKFLGVGPLCSGLAALGEAEGLLVLRDGVLEEVVVGAEDSSAIVDDDLLAEGVGEGCALLVISRHEDSVSVTLWR